MSEINILSLFDGMSCGQIALNKLGIKYDNYYASEIDKYSVAVTNYNFPKTKQLGDVKSINFNELSNVFFLLNIQIILNIKKRWKNIKMKTYDVS